MKPVSFLQPQGVLEFYPAFFRCPLSSDGVPYDGEDVTMDVDALTVMYASAAAGRGVSFIAHLVNRQGELKVTIISEYISLLDIQQADVYK